MFPVLLERLITLVVILVILYGIYRWATRVKISEEHKAELREALLHINATIETSENLPKVDVEKLKKARERIENLLKEGRKNERKG